nr:MAG TPA: hypothetical protein [Caudoviricetes sp.]DAJ45681.1 MAG TPA: hypothetical protein [Caudoviricetes sp.]DAZ34948.1 MAG TPA: hypothetical protein [Caudoviricetes sp.]
MWCYFIILYFTRLKSRFLGFVPSYLPLGTERSN